MKSIKYLKDNFEKFLIEESKKTNNGELEEGFFKNLTLAALLAMSGVGKAASIAEPDPKQPTQITQTQDVASKIQVKSNDFKFDQRTGKWTCIMVTTDGQREIKTTGISIEKEMAQFNAASQAKFQWQKAK